MEAGSGNGVLLIIVRWFAVESMGLVVLGGLVSLRKCVCACLVLIQ